jgi:hypothetical protein
MNIFHNNRTPPDKKNGGDGAWKPVRRFSIDRVFRNETTDATHLAEFHQIEGFIADYNLSLAGMCVCVCGCVCVTLTVCGRVCISACVIKHECVKLHCVFPCFSRASRLDWHHL